MDRCPLVYLIPTRGSTIEICNKQHMQYIEHLEQAKDQQKQPNDFPLILQGPVQGTFELVKNHFDQLMPLKSGDLVGCILPLDPVFGFVFRTYCGWTKSCHFETTGSHCLLVQSRGALIPGFLRCETDSASQYAPTFPWLQELPPSTQPLLQPLLSQSFTQPRPKRSRKPKSKSQAGGRKRVESASNPKASNPRRRRQSGWLGAFF